MLKQIDTPSQQLVHHPSDVLDDLCHYAATDRNWLEFDHSLSRQLIAFEFKNRRFIRLQPVRERRAMSS